MGKESYRANVGVGKNDRRNSSDSVVQSVGFYNDRLVRNPMSKNRSRSKSLFEFVEGLKARIVEVPGSIFLGKSS